MPRIPNDAIDQIKQTTDIIALIQSRGTTLKQKGTNWIGLCPFHNDTNTPNLIVTPSKGLFRCMAADCGKTGNAIQFVQYHDGLSFRHAFELLDKGGKAAFENATTTPTAKAQTTKLACPVTPEEENLLERVAEYYHSRLTSPDGQAALEYLKLRGLELSETTLKRFKIGVSDRTLGIRIPHSRTVKGEAIRKQLIAEGVYRKKTKREHLIGCLTVPIMNLEGATTQIYGRRIGKTTKDNRHLYLAKKQEGIFNAEILHPDPKSSKEIILCESIIDALTFYHHGMENVTCTYGTSHLSSELIEAIKSAKIETIKLAFDADPSGEKATTKVAEILHSLGIQVYQIKFPWGTDANQYAQDQGKSALQQTVRNAQLCDGGFQPPSQTTKSPETIPSKVIEAPSKNSVNLVNSVKENPPTPPDESRAPSSFLAAKLAAEAAEYAAKEKKDGSVDVSSASTQAPNPSHNLSSCDPCASLRQEKTTLQQVGDYHQLTLENRTYRIGGLYKKQHPRSPQNNPPHHF